MPDLNDDFVKMHAAWLLLFFNIDMQDKLIMVKLYTSNIQFIPFGIHNTANKISCIVNTNSSNVYIPTVGYKLRPDVKMCSYPTWSFA